MFPGLLAAQQREVEPGDIGPAHLVTGRLCAFGVGLGQGMAQVWGHGVRVALDQEDALASHVLLRQWIRRHGGTARAACP